MESGYLANMTITKVISFVLKTGLIGTLSRIKIEILLTPKKVLRKIYQFEPWHVNLFSNRNYACFIVQKANLEQNRMTALEIGCGLGDISRRLKYTKVEAVDNMSEVINGAKCLAKFSLNRKKVDFKLLDIVSGNLKDSYDLIIIVNWIHNLDHINLSCILKKLFIHHLNNGGLLIFDVVDNPGYLYNHSAKQLIGNLIEENDAYFIEYDGFSFGRKLVFLRKSLS